MTNFPTAMPILLECARQETEDLFRIGDALVDETDGSQRTLRKVSAALKASGRVGDDMPRWLRGYRASALQKLFDTSVAFPPDRRRDVSWELHAEAGNPDFLDEILAVQKHYPDTFRPIGGMLRFAKEHAKRQRYMERRARKGENP